MVMFRTRNPRLSISGPPIVATLTPDSASLTFSDYAGSLTRDASHARLVRPISDGQGYEYAAPGARVSFSVTTAAASSVRIDAQYTGLVTRTDTYNDVASVLVNGSRVIDLVCPTTHTPGGAHPVAAAHVLVPIPAGTSVVTLVWPYCASLDLVSVGRPAGVSFNAAPSALAKRLAFFGDSRAHGFNASRATESWPFKAAVTKAGQQLNVGYGGRRIVAGDGTVAGALGCDAAVYLAGYNNFYPNGANITAVQALYAGVIANYRSAATAAGKPTSKLVMLSDLDAPEAYGSGTYAGNSPTLQAFRDALSAAVTAAADSNCVFLSGNTGGMPTGLGSYPDGVHPSDATATVIAGLVAAVLP